MVCRVEWAQSMGRWIGKSEALGFTKIYLFRSLSFCHSVLSGRIVQVFQAYYKTHELMESILGAYAHQSTYAAATATEQACALRFGSTSNTTIEFRIIDKSGDGQKWKEQKKNKKTKFHNEEEKKKKWWSELEMDFVIGYIIIVGFLLDVVVVVVSVFLG